MLDASEKTRLIAAAAATEDHQTWAIRSFRRQKPPIYAQTIAHLEYVAPTVFFSEKIYLVYVFAYNYKRPQCDGATY